DGAGGHLLAQGVAPRGVALAEKAQVDGKAVRGLEHAVDVPRPRRARRGIGAGGGAGAAPDQRGHACREGLLDELRADEVDVRIDAARGDDAYFARDDLGGGSHGHPRSDARLDVRVPRLAHADDAAAAHADIALDDAPVIEHDGVGDDEVEHALARGGAGGLAHAVANHLAAPELDLVAVDGEVALDLDEELG